MSFVRVPRKSCDTASVQPPRGPLTESVWRFFGVTFGIATILHLPIALFEVRYPGWLNVIGGTLIGISVAAFVVFLAMRAGEVIGQREQR